MVLRYTSTSFGTLLRSMAATVRAAGRPLGSPARLRFMLARTLEAAAARAPHAAHPVTASARNFSSSASIRHSPRTVNYGNTKHTFARAGYRPSARTPRGPAVPATVGLGAARTFATAPAAGSFQSGVHNVPVVLRAFAQLIDDDTLPRPKRYAPYVPRRRQRTSRATRGVRAPRRQSAASTTSTSSTSAVLRELGHYFPVVIPATEEVALPPQPETLVSEGYTATLALPLAPSLTALLAPTAEIPYADAEIGVAVLARLTHGILPLHEAYAAAGARVIPLLAKLEALGVLDVNAFPATTLDIALDYRGEPDILRIVFAGRCAQDVRELLGDALDADACWALSDAKHATIVPLEEDEAREQWNQSEQPCAQVEASAASVDLIMPTLDLSAAPTVVPSRYDSAFDSWPSPSPSPASSMSEYSSPSSTGVSTPYSFGSLGDSWDASSAGSLSPSSLVSSLAALSDEHTGWISPPTAADDLDAWSDSWSTTDDGDLRENQVEEVEMFWVGGGLSLTQSW